MAFRGPDTYLIQAKGDTIPQLTPPPPPRSQTTSPSRVVRPDERSLRAMTETPMSGETLRNGTPPSGPPSTSNNGAPTTFAETPNGGIKRMKSSLAVSLTAADMPPVNPADTTTPMPPSRQPTVASLDDLLSRPPSKRPASAAARKGARNRYVDVLQTGTEAT